MKEEVIKVSYKSYLFELVFFTDYCALIKATDVYDGRVYQNKNAEFHKIPKATVIAALQQKNKEITFQVSEKLIEDQMNRSADEMKVQEKRCLDLIFVVNSDFIVPFSEKIILYEIESNRKSEKILPQQISSKTANEIRKSIDLIDKSLSNANEKDDQIKVYEIGILGFAQRETEELIAIYVMIGYGVFSLILWSTYLEFLQFLVMIIIGGLFAYYYFSSQKYLVTKIQLKEGYYKVEVTGIISTPANYSNQNVSFYLWAGFNYLKRQKRKLYFYSNYSYGAPFNATFLIDCKKSQELLIEIQKNKIYSINVNNIIITCEKIPFISKVQ